MKNIFLIIVFSFFTTNFIQAQGIQFFEGTWQEALALSKKENKPIFVDAYTVWCGPCKYMAKNVFTNSNVGTYYNENFINYKYDMEKGDGPDFANRYKITAYPTLLYITADEKVILRKVGGRQPEDLIKDGVNARVVFDYK